MRRRLVLAAPFAWMALIFAGSSLPGHALPSIHVWDKLEHGIEYGILGALGYAALRTAGLSRLAAFACASVGCGLYGISDEWHQSFVPHRDVEARDALADFIGGTVASGVLAAWDRLRGDRPAA